MDDIVQLVILALIFLLSALFGGRKKKRQQRPRPPVARRPAPRPARRAPEPAPRTISYTPPPESDTLAEEIFTLLRGERPAEPLPQAEAPGRPLDTREAISLEELEIDETQRHEEFHERLAAVPADAYRAIQRRQPIRLRLSPRTLREAVVWREVVGPPKALEM